MMENDEPLSKIGNPRINSKYLALIDNKSNGFVDHEDTRTELKFEKDAQSLAEFEKRKIIEISLERPTNLDTWRNLAIGEYGLVEDDLRRKVWPLLLEVDPDENNEKIPTLLELSDHDEYNQVVLDVNRSLSRFPPGIPLKQRLALQDQLTVLILRVIMKYPHLKYYQGYHDVAITFLLVVGEVIAFRIMERLSTDHLKECMESTMEKTSFRLNYMYPLLHRIDEKLHNFLEMSSVGTMFALPWYLTWFGHSLNRYKDVVRLYDFFLASPPLMSIYVATALVVARRDEIFKQDCDLASIHCLLAQIPDDIDFEKILEKASFYYQRYKPEDLEKDVIKRVKREYVQLEFSGMGLEYILPYNTKSTNASRT
ncbi:TBC1 domain family member 20 isoform X2 [Coccinella septempunctata]|uniref:TBC1 domain family member 20 isoform X2 n=1 Tax=Coccinella septempunctata TaxID=41139 RepID=UPI001D082549|nr:TBC1 domain family member 20 isoform X2 [Coccinella septempunctata]